jgi:hypothetical protein
MRTSYFLTVVWDISASSEDLRTLCVFKLFKLKPGLNAPRALHVLQPETGKLCHLVKKSKRSDGKQYV